MRVTPSDYLDRGKINAISLALNRERSSDVRHQKLLDVACINPLISARAYSGRSKPELGIREKLIEIVHTKLQELVHKASSKQLDAIEELQLEFSLFALLELKAVTQLLKALIAIPQKTKLYRLILSPLFKDRDQPAQIFQILNTLFDEICVTKDDNKIYHVWIAALRLLPNDLYMQGGNYPQQISNFFQYFVQQSYHSSSVPLLWKKFPKQYRQFDGILQQASKPTVYFQKNLLFSPELMREIHECGERLDAYSYSSIIRSVLYKNGFAQARQILQEVFALGIKLNIMICNTILNKADNFIQAQMLLKEMLEQGIEADVFTYSAVLNKADSFTQAQTLLKEMFEQGIQADVITYNTVLSKADNFAQAQTLLREMFEQGIQADVITYNTVLSKADNFAQAQTLLKEMFEQGIEADVVTYSTVLNKADNFTQAQTLLREMLEQGIQADVFTYNTVLNKADNFTQAHTLLREMLEQGIEANVFTYNIVLKKAVQGRCPLNIILGLLEEMIQRGIKPQAGLSKKQKPYTHFAIEEKIGRSHKPFQIWVGTQQAALKQLPNHVRTEWEYLFSMCLNQNDHNLHN